MEKTESKIFLTGIKPTGSPHIGNWLGAIRPALEAAASFEARYFIADYHALNSVKDPAALRRNTKNAVLPAVGYSAGIRAGNASERLHSERTDEPGARV